MVPPIQKQNTKSHISRNRWQFAVSILFAHFLYSIWKSDFGLQLIALLVSYLLLGIVLFRIAKKHDQSTTLNQRQIDLILDASPSGIAIKSINEKSLLRISERMRRIIGCDSEVSSEDIIELLDTTFRLKNESNSTETTGPHFKREDGSIIWVEIDRKEINTDKGESALVVYTVTDITDIRNAREDFIRKDAQMQFIFNSAPIGLHWSCDRTDQSKGPIKDRLVNAAHQAITGLSKEEMDIPGMFSAITHPQDAIRQHEERKLLISKETDRISIRKTLHKKRWNDCVGIRFMGPKMGFRWSRLRRSKLHG